MNAETLKKFQEYLRSRHHSAMNAEGHAEKGTIQHAHAQSRAAAFQACRAILLEMLIEQ